jgi:hypothetical protein
VRLPAIDLAHLDLAVGKPPDSMAEVSAACIRRRPAAAFSS